MDLDLAAVRTVVAVAEEGQFSYAADVLGISQQSVSKRIAKIEAQLRTALFERTPAGATLTPAGALFLPQARAILASVDAAVRAVRTPLRVAVHGDRIADAEVMRFYRGQHPDADVETIIASTTPRDAVIDGTVDAALARAHWAAAPLPKDITAVPAYLEPLRLLVGKDHPLATRTHVTLDDLRPYPAWIPGAAIRSEWADFYHHLSQFSGIRIETGPRAEPIQQVIEQVIASTTLTTFTGEATSTPWHPDSRQIPITDPVPVYPFALLWKSGNLHPELPHFIDHVRCTYNEDAAGGCWLPEPDRALFGLAPTTQRNGPPSENAGRAVRRRR
ncbi:LysR family transcriptional regulator [Nocardia mangyaensis]|uniref:LysR family transcriptional regulator n=1 Tax=Nocardia mangyaensis TaxID=2213200 RepID=UPI002674DDE4|nr:LysR family transcriptional regulator [Nocardia mangyaensis]MDO3650546.1 LysR family transcriptional regulator [Nocardia mangyaensis]